MKLRVYIERVAVDPSFGDHVAQSFRRDFEAAFGGGIEAWSELAPILDAAARQGSLPDLSIVMGAAFTHQSFGAALGTEVRDALQGPLAAKGRQR